MSRVSMNDDDDDDDDDVCLTSGARQKAAELKGCHFPSIFSDSC